MSDRAAKDLISRGNQLFNKKEPILSLWQALTEQFDPMGADYTYTRSIGMEFASHLMTGSPSMASQDLANAISAMCRPPGQMWAHARTGNDSIDKDITNLRWLDMASTVMMRAFYRNRSGFRRATVEGDRGFSCIGNACIRVRPNRDFTGISYRAKHMRDVAFAENDDGFVDEVHVKDKISVRSMIRKFGRNKVSEKVINQEEKDPFGEVQCRHVIMPSDEYDGGISRIEQGPNGTTRRVGYALPWVSIIIDVDNETVLEEIGQAQMGYVPPRWSTKPGFGYGYSPSSTINVADARMLQQITLTLLEAGQKAVDPPMQAMGNDVIQGGVNLFAGGISWIDPDYDERTGPALKPLYGSNPNLGWGVDREDRIEKLIRRGHFLDQIKFPDTSKARTAYETQKMWEEFIRSATPLFEPIGAEYNGPLCDETFTLLLRLNAFGPVADIPRALRGRDIHFEFESPLTVGQAAALAQTFTSVGQITSLATSIDPSVRHDLDLDEAYRDALTSSGAPATWIIPKARADAIKADERQQMAAQQAADAATQQVGNAAEAAGKIGQAANLLQQGGIVPPQQPQLGGAM